MFQINLRSQQSICEQIIDNIKELIIRGVLPEDSGFRPSGNCKM